MKDQDTTAAVVDTDGAGIAFGDLWPLIGRTVVVIVTKRRGQDRARETIRIAGRVLAVCQHDPTVVDDGLAGTGFLAMDGGVVARWSKHDEVTIFPTD